MEGDEESNEMEPSVERFIELQWVESANGDVSRQHTVA